MNKWLIGLIVGIIFAALIISGVVIYLSKPKTEWKTYENKEWGFRIKYPAGWESSVTTNDKEEGFGIRFCPSVGKENERDVFAIMILDAVGLSLEEITNDSIDIFGILFWTTIRNVRA
jgi:hypothetical protein